MILLISAEASIVSDIALTLCTELSTTFSPFRASFAVSVEDISMLEVFFMTSRMV